MHNPKKLHAFPSHCILYIILIINMLIIYGKVVFTNTQLSHKQLSHTSRNITRENTISLKNFFFAFFNTFSKIFKKYFLSQQKKIVPLFFLVTSLSLSTRLSHISRDVTRENTLLLKKKFFMFQSLFPKIFKIHYLSKQKKIVPLFLFIITSLSHHARIQCRTPQKHSSNTLVHTPEKRHLKNATEISHSSTRSHRDLVYNNHSSIRYITTHNITLVYISNQTVAIRKASPQPNPLKRLFAVVICFLLLSINVSMLLLPTFTSIRCRYSFLPLTHVLYAVKQLIICRHSIYYLLSIRPSGAPAIHPFFSMSIIICRRSVY